VGVYRHVTPSGDTLAMATDDDLFHTAVGAVERRIWPMLWDVAPSRRSAVAEAAVRAAAPFLDGSEHARVAEADGDTVTT
jgi:hypothetical protein